MFAVTGGGTGGHLSVARAIAIELKNRGFDVIFIGSKTGQDISWFGQNSPFDKTYFLNTTGVVNRKFFGKIIALLKLFFSLFAIFSIFRTHKIKAIISVGGFSAAPASIGSIIFRKRLFIHEQNAKIGALNKLLHRASTLSFSSFKLDNFIQVPHPINTDFATSKRTRSDLTTVLFLGGSQGASFINNLALHIAPFLHKNNISIIHQTGKLEYNYIKSAYAKMHINADIFSFGDLLYRVKKADICIARAGASSLFELASNALPCILIPYPYAASNHQFYNAKFLSDKGLGVLLEQSEIKEGDLSAFYAKFDFLRHSLFMVSSNLYQYNNIETNMIDLILKEINAN
ncbi:MAG: UDP-N-acetylglucosamine--N-acetylmuramyl-(pentapeptide) pyrophosphoryl-undecaprenol N-acetylglucosamine transferase [Helicobacter sp.]|nr:UDP-N-acetylglucosamine--N-acetylmuramyl-(pentapeptide) pyrophosphoryl-undecaprenol N-acetylglucosamine transferase [Helicobacter sp.]